MSKVVYTNFLLSTVGITTENLLMASKFCKATFAVPECPEMYLV